MPTYDPALYANQTSELPAETEIVITVLEILGKLRPIFADLTAMQQTWNLNGIPALIEAAALAGEPLAGHPAGAWQAWGTVFTELQNWLVTPIASIGATPLQVLMKKYPAVQ